MHAKLGGIDVTAITDGGLSIKEGPYVRRMRPVFGIEVLGPCAVFASKY